MFTAVAQPRFVRSQAKVATVNLPVQNTTQKPAGRQARSFVAVLLRALSVCVA